ncbi:hypothetical protein Cus16_0589 [Curtobacterium sp. ER1/6]|nr:hypothetical protein Cus16_0589 [Curtobacterium sp. ER1/6]
MRAPDGGWTAVGRWSSVRRASGGAEEVAVGRLGRDVAVRAVVHEGVDLVGVPQTAAVPLVWVALELVEVAEAHRAQAPSVTTVTAAVATVTATMPRLVATTASRRPRAVSRTSENCECVASMVLMAGPSRDVGRHRSATGTSLLRSL